MPEASDQAQPAVDPLTALRSADHRPLHEQWRQRIDESIRERSVDRRVIVVLAVFLAAIMIGQMLVRSSEPPIEDSLPWASSTTTNPTVAEAPTVASETATPTGATSLAAEGAGSILVHVAGAVQVPGLTTGTVDWRVADAVAAAGGFAADADLDRINLAAQIRDGQRVWVPRVGEEAPSVVSGVIGQMGASEGAGVPIDLNRADASALEGLPGVGPVTAGAIVSHREEHGMFASVEALVAVRGIGPATLDRLRDHATVG